MTIRELCEKEVVQLEQGVCLGRADDLTFDPATARLQSLILLGRPRLFGLLGRDDSLTIPWQEIETIGTDAVLVHTALPEAPPQPEQLKWWQKAAREAGFVNFLQKQGGLFCGSDYNNRRSFVQKA